MYVVYVWLIHAGGVGVVVSLCVSLFYVSDISSRGPRGPTWGVSVYTCRLNSDAGYDVLLLTLLGAPVSSVSPCFGCCFSLIGIGVPFALILEGLCGSHAEEEEEACTRDPSGRWQRNIYCQGERERVSLIWKCLPQHWQCNI